MTLLITTNDVRTWYCWTWFGKQEPLLL